MDIQIWDNLIDDRFLLDFDEESNHYHWKLDNIANRYSFPYNKKGSHLFWGVGIPLESQPKSISNLYSYLSENFLGPNYKLHYIQINGQSMGQQGAGHFDRKYGVNQKSLMVFFNYKWNKEWGGEFQLLKENSNEIEVIKNIEYVPGRIILFDGNILHRALAPKEPYVIRKSLVYGLEKLCLNNLAT